MEYESPSFDASKDLETNSICERLVKSYKICIIIFRLVRRKHYFVTLSSFLLFTSFI